MAITIHIPEKSKAFNITNEIKSASNIKDRATRNNTLDGLNRIKTYL